MRFSPTPPAAGRQSRAPKAAALHPTRAAPAAGPDGHGGSRREVFPDAAASGCAALYGKGVRGLQNAVDWQCPHPPFAEAMKAQQEVGGGSSTPCRGLPGEKPGRPLPARGGAPRSPPGRASTDSSPQSLGMQKRRRGSLVGCRRAGRDSRASHSTVDRRQRWRCQQQQQRQQGDPAPPCPPTPSLEEPKPPLTQAGDPGVQACWPHPKEAGGGLGAHLKKKSPSARQPLSR